MCGAFKASVGKCSTCYMLILTSQLVNGNNLNSLPQLTMSGVGVGVQTARTSQPAPNFGILHNVTLVKIINCNPTKI